MLVGAGIVGAAAFGAACHPGPKTSQQPEHADDSGLLFLSTQLRPVEEAEKMRKHVLAGYDGAVSFVGSDLGPFLDRLRAEAGGKGRISLVGSLHGDLLTLAEEGLLLDLGDLAEELSGRDFHPDFLELAHFHDAPVYIPWMQATYLMVARWEAVDLLPSGTDIDDLGYDQLLAWAARVNREQGGRKLGFPAAPDGLIRRFLQGYALPSFTGALHTRFQSDDAVTMWAWMRQAWTQSSRQSPSYAFMQQPLQAGEVWIAWDHVARLVDALKAEPSEFVAFPAPAGPKGLGYIPVLTGLAIPKNSPDPQGAMRLIRYLTRPATAQVTMAELGFFPPTTTFALSSSLSAHIRGEARAVQRQTTNPRARPSLLPMGLKDQTYAYDEVFRAIFDEVVVQRRPIPAALQAKGRQLQSVLDSVEARCWLPDPPSSGTCRVGG